MNHNVLKSLKNQHALILCLQNNSLYFQLSTILETGLSELRLLRVIKLKQVSQKVTRKRFRDYKKFNNNAYRSDIQNPCSSEADLGFFKDYIFYIFNKHAPIRKKYFPQMNPILCLKNYTLLSWGQGLLMRAIKSFLMKNNFVKYLTLFF